MARMLNDYVEEKIQRGKLEDKKVNLNIFLIPPDACELCPLEVSQNRNGYYIITYAREYPLEYFVRIIDYFSSDDWESFVCSDPGLQSWTAERVFNGILDRRTPQLDMSFFEGRSVVAFQLGDLAVIYKNDRLRIEIGGKGIGLDINVESEERSISPARVRDRYFVVVWPTMYVFDINGELVNETAIPSPRSLYTGMEGYDKWMNYYDSRVCVLSYSCDQNRFYHLSVEW
jgi:hypothetical protein